jgi:hypothetical protein
MIEPTSTTPPLLIDPTLNWQRPVVEPTTKHYTTPTHWAGCKWKTNDRTHDHALHHTYIHSPGNNWKRGKIPIIEPTTSTTPLLLMSKTHKDQWSNPRLSTTPPYIYSLTDNWHALHHPNAEPSQLEPTTRDTTKTTSPFQHGSKRI